MGRSGGAGSSPRRAADDPIVFQAIIGPVSRRSGFQS